MEDMPVSLRSRISLVRRLVESKAFRDGYVFEHVRNGLAFQLRGIRDALGWSQAKMGQEVGKPQNVISRLEDPNYGRPNLQTLLEIASGLGMGLLVKFVPFSRLVQEYEDVSPEALAVARISDRNEQKALKSWANRLLTIQPAAINLSGIINTTISDDSAAKGESTWRPEVIKGGGARNNTYDQRGLFPAAVPAIDSKVTTVFRAPVFHLGTSRIMLKIGDTEDDIETGSGRAVG